MYSLSTANPAAKSVVRGGRGTRETMHLISPEMAVDRECDTNYIIDESNENSLHGLGATVVDGLREKRGMAERLYSYIAIYICFAIITVGVAD